MGISKRRARAGEGGWPALGSPFLPIPVPRKNSKSLKKSLYPIFVELGRRAWVWEAYLRGGGIILAPDILLKCLYKRMPIKLLDFSKLKLAYIME